MKLSMKCWNKDNKMWRRRLLAAVFILLFLCIQEAAANYHALTGEYELLELDGRMQKTVEDGKEKYYLYYQAEPGLYAGQLKIRGDFREKSTYTVDVMAVNSFGKTEEISYTDTVDPRLPEACTDIGKEVTSIKITMPKAAGKAFLSASLTNRPEINKYRLLFWLLTLCFFYVVFFEKKALEKLEWTFAIFAMGFGLLLILTSQPERVSWDEQIHFRNAYRVAYGTEVRWSKAAAEVREAAGPKCNTKAEYAQLRQYMDEQGKEALMLEDRTGTYLEYDDLAYLPQAVLLRAGIGIGLPFSAAYALGKLGNLLVYVFAMFWAIRLAKFRKLFLLFFAMLPTVLFQASSYTYDNVVTSLVTLGCVLWVNMMYGEAKDRSTGKMILTVLLWVVGCFSKAVYIPVVLLMLLLPQFQTAEKRRRLFIYGGVVLVFGLVAMTFVLPAVSNTVAGNLSYGGDARGGDTSTVRQMISMVKHPLPSIKLMFENMFSLDNFRNLGNGDSDLLFFGNLMFLNYASLGMLGDKWCALLVPVFFMLMFYEDKEEKEIRIGRGSRIFMALVLVMTLFLIWLALYLSFTPVGDEVISGVQARYYLPFIYFLAIFFMNDKLRFRMKRELAAKMALGTGGLLTAVMIYQCALAGRFF